MTNAKFSIILFHAFKNESGNTVNIQAIHIAIRMELREINFYKNEPIFFSYKYVKVWLIILSGSEF